MEKDTLEPTTQGVPQTGGGIISPLIGNYALDGLEQVINNALTSLTKSKTRVKLYPKTSGTNLVKKFKIHFVRCEAADDFLVLASSKHIVHEYIKPAVTLFLAQRSLQLSSEKTKIYTLKEYPLHFLGYTFMYKDKWKNHVFPGKGYQPGVALIPMKEKLKAITLKLKRIFHTTTHTSSATLIQEVNPIIRG